jgi:hypothetical protein
MAHVAQHGPQPHGTCTHIHSVMPYAVRTMCGEAHQTRWQKAWGGGRPLPPPTHAVCCCPVAPRPALPSSAALCLPPLPPPSRPSSHHHGVAIVCQRCGHLPRAPACQRPAGGCGLAQAQVNVVTRVLHGCVRQAGRQAGQRQGLPDAGAGERGRVECGGLGRAGRCGPPAMCLPTWPNDMHACCVARTYPACTLPLSCPPLAPPPTHTHCCYHCHRHLPHTP